MTTVVATHAVGNMDTWLAGGDARKGLFANFCTGYRIYQGADGDRVSLVFDGVDLEKMKTMLASPEATADKAKHTVIDPIEVYIEVENGS